MPETAEVLDRDGFTPAEQAYFASQGQDVDGLLDDTGSTAPDTGGADPVVDPKVDTAAIVDPAADPFDELEKVATDNRGKTGKVIPEANFRAVSEKYKLTKSERDELRERVKSFEDRTKSIEGELAKEREMRTRIDERLKLFNEVIAPQAAGEPAPPAEMPNPEEDIFGAFKWAADRIKQLEGQTSQTSQTLQDTAAETNLRTTYQADAQRFARETPDFLNAYNHVNRVRDQMLESIGYNDPNQRAQIRMDEERALVAQALQAGKSPAATIYGVAKSLGYAKAAPAAEPTPTVPGAQAAPATPAAPSVTEEIERIAKGQAASRSLSSAGGAPAGAMTVEVLANMTEPEFEAYARKNPNVVKELMGG
jgi:hypothetical protein